MSSPEIQERFVRTLTRYESRVWAFIRSLVVSRADAEDILQETNATLWKKIDEFAEVENFVAWACAVARIEVLRYYQKQKRDRLQFSENFLQTVAEQVTTRRDELDDRVCALESCIEKLLPQDRGLIRQRYVDELSVETLSTMVGRSVEAVYKRLSRIRRALFVCIEKAVSS